MNQYADAIELALFLVGFFLLITGSYDIGGGRRRTWTGYVHDPVISLSGTSVRLAGLILMLPAALFLGGEWLLKTKGQINVSLALSQQINTLLTLYGKLIPYQTQIIGGSVLIAIVLVMSGRVTHSDYPY